MVNKKDREGYDETACFNLVSAVIANLFVSPDLAINPSSYPNDTVTDMILERKRSRIDFVENKKLINMWGDIAGINHEIIANKVIEQNKLELVYKFTANETFSNSSMTVSLDDNFLSIVSSLEHEYNVYRYNTYDGKLINETYIGTTKEYDKMVKESQRVHLL